MPQPWPSLMLQTLRLKETMGPNRPLAAEEPPPSVGGSVGSGTTVADAPSAECWVAVQAQISEGSCSFIQGFPGPAWQGHLLGGQELRQQEWRGGWEPWTEGLTSGAS